MTPNSSEYTSKATGDRGTSFIGMATDKQVADFNLKMLTSGDGEFSQEETRLQRSPKNNKFAIKTQMEKILLIVAFVLLILCIVFIALLAKESSSDDDSSSSSTSSGRSGKCDLFNWNNRQIWLAMFITLLPNSHFWIIHMVG